MSVSVHLSSLHVHETYPARYPMKHLLIAAALGLAACPSPPPPSQTTPPHPGGEVIQGGRFTMTAPTLKGGRFVLRSTTQGGIR